jgi:hypothetical protein
VENVRDKRERKIGNGRADAQQSGTNAHSCKGCVRENNNNNNNNKNDDDENNSLQHCKEVPCVFCLFCDP